MKTAAKINEIAARVVAGDRAAAAALVYIDAAERAIARCVAGTCLAGGFHSRACARAA